MKKKIILILILILILLLICCKIVFAETLQEKKDAIQSQLDEANQAAEETDIELNGLLVEVNNLNEKINSYQTEVDDLSIQVSGLQDEINNTESQLKTIEEDYANQKKLLGNRIVAQYEAGETQYLDVLLHSKSLSEFISNYYLISEVAKYDNDILNNIKKEQESIAIIKENLKSKKEEIKSIKDDKEKKFIILENAKNAKNKYVKQLSAQELAIQKQIDDYELELSKLEYTGGVFGWPTPRKYNNNIKFWIQN